MKDGLIASTKWTVMLLSHKILSHDPLSESHVYALLLIQVTFSKLEQSPFGCTHAQWRKTPHFSTRCIRFFYRKQVVMTVIIIYYTKPFLCFFLFLLDAQARWAVCSSSASPQHSCVLLPETAHSPNWSTIVWWRFGDSPREKTWHPFSQW